MGRFQQRSLLVSAFSIAALLVGPLALGQDAPIAQPETVIDVLHQLSDKADVIFAGQVVAIRRSSYGVVEVEFRVDQAIRGCASGTPYVLREWAGLWEADNQRYRVGQRLLMLLHAPSAAGMSSPVSGLDGAIPIRQGGTTTTPEDTGTPRQPPFVDLRWLGVRLPRSVTYSNEPLPIAHSAGVATLAFAQRQVVGVASKNSIANTAAAQKTDNGSPSEGSVPAQQASVDAVIGMLTSWQKAQHAAP